MSSEEFEALSFKFSTKEESSNEALNLEFSKDDFKEIEGSSATALYKIAAFNMIERSQNAGV